jgi:hypothetical protein
MSVRALNLAESGRCACCPPVRFIGHLSVREHLRPKRGLAPLPATVEELEEQARAIGTFAQDLWEELTACSLYAPGDPEEHPSGWRWDLCEFVPYREVLAMPVWGEA